MAQSSEIRVVVDGLRAFIGRVTQKIALDVHANLVAAPSEGGTPIDTGFARANWLPRVGSPDLRTVGSRESVVEGAAASGLGQVAGYRGRLVPIYVTNSVPYIGYLNAGSSPQAPRGFVRAAVVRAVEELRRS